MGSIELSTPLQRPAQDAAHARAPGAMLDRYKIEHVLRVSSFSVIYRARETAADAREVAIKEYFPIAIAARDDAGHIAARSATHEATYAEGLRAFLSEAETYSRLQHPNLLGVSHFFEAHGSAYRVMPVYAGSNLLARRYAMTQPPSEAWLRQLLEGLIGGLGVLHGAGLAHTHIEPLNILLRVGDDLPVLMDGNAVRRAILGHVPTRALPEEQAGDLRALAALMHFGISGQWPLLSSSDAFVRKPLDDILADLSQRSPRARYSTEFVSSIDTALTLPLDEQPQNIAEFRALFDHRPLPDGVRVIIVADDDDDSMPATSGAPAAPRLMPPRLEREQPLTSSESVLELLARFERKPKEVADEIEQFQPPLPAVQDRAVPPPAAPLDAPAVAVDALPAAAPASRWRRAVFWIFVGVAVLLAVASIGMQVNV